MNLSLNWLSDFVDVSDITAKKYCDEMTLSGSKVEGYEILGGDIENVVVGKIVAISKHENSDHLQICMLDCGEEKLRQIVTGAQNVFEGAYVPVAKAPAKLPGGVTIKSGKLRGVDSDGMLCSISELGLTTHDMPSAAEDGILILDDTYKIGDDIKDALMLSDTAVEFEITPNRPDCLSILGLARESAATFDRTLKYTAPKVCECDDGDDISKYLSVKINEPKLCPRYSARVVKNVKIEPSPLWLRARLRACGVRPINNIVDITNYVMLEYGQPMHAFDAKCLDGNAITVRLASEGEKFKSLDDIDHVLESDMLVISDEKKAVALAGVMGGANSEITGETKTVVFESANFFGASVRVCAKKLGMRTESSGRFEKGLDCENTMPALQRACELVNLLGAGDVVRGAVDVYPKKKEQRRVKLDAAKINSFLGIDVSEDYMRGVLEKLFFTLSGDEIIVPSWRDDVECMNDVAEEIARIYGYNKIEATSVRGGITGGGRNAAQTFELGLHALMCGMGADEISTFSFISPKYYDKINLDANDTLRTSIKITNPLGEDTSVMRTTPLPSMLEVLARNFNFSNENVSLYEVATVYIPNEDKTELPDERKILTFGFYGKGDFYTLKSMCESVAKYSRVKFEYKTCCENRSYHPGRCAGIYSADGGCIGTLGEIHPAVIANYGMNIPVYVATIDMAALMSGAEAKGQYKPLPKYPSSSRDFSFVCDEDLPVGTIEGIMRRAGGKILEDVKLFDIYRGVQLGADKKSVSFRIILRSGDHTLTVEECDKAAKKVLDAIQNELGISIRA